MAQISQILALMFNQGLSSPDLQDSAMNLRKKLCFLREVGLFGMKLYTGLTGVTNEQAAERDNDR